MGLIYKYQVGNKLKTNKLLDDYSKELSTIKSKANKLDRKSDDFWSLGLTQIAEIKKNNKVSDKEYEVKAKVLLNNINKLRNK